MHQALRNADGAVDTSTLAIEENKLIGDVVIGFPQRSHSTGVYTGAPNGAVVNLFARSQHLLRSSANWWRRCKFRCYSNGGGRNFISKNNGK